MADVLKFYEVGKGKLAQQVQEAFLRAHKVMFETGEKVRVVLGIDVLPPEGDAPEYGNIAWDVEVKAPKKKSIKHITVLSGGLPVSDGTDVAQALQYEMNLEDRNGNQD